MEEFPALIRDSEPTTTRGAVGASNASPLVAGAAWRGNAPRMHQAPHKEELKSTSEFPGLPEPSVPVGRRPQRTKTTARTEYLRQLRPQTLRRRA